jgi:hypothetical protein
MENYCANFSVKIGYFVFDCWFEHVQSFGNASCCSLLQRAKLSKLFQSSVLGVLIFSEIQGIKRKGVKSRRITKTRVFTASSYILTVSVR